MGFLTRTIDHDAEVLAAAEVWVDQVLLARKAPKWSQRLSASLKVPFARRRVLKAAEARRGAQS